MAGLDGERAGPSLRRVSEIWAGDRRPRLGQGRRRRRRRRRRARSRAGGDGRRARRRRTDDGGAVVTHDAHCASGRGGNGEDKRRGDDERRATARGTFERDGATDGRTDDGRRSAEDERAGRRGGTHSRAGSKRVGDGARVDREDAAARRARGYDRVATVRCVLRCDRAMDGGSRCEPAVVLALQQMQLQLHVTPLEETLFFTATPSHRRSRRTRDASPSTPHRRPRPASAPRRAAHRVVRSAPHRRDGAVRHVHRGQEHGPAVSDGGRAAEDGPSRPRRGRRHHGHHVVRDADAGVSDQETGARAPGGARRRLARRVESSRRAFARRFRARVET